MKLLIRQKFIAAFWERPVFSLILYTSHFQEIGPGPEGPRAGGSSCLGEVSNGHSEFPSSFEPVTSKLCKLACASIEDSDQPAHPYSLIIVFDGHSMGSQWSNISSDGKIRLIRLYVHADLFESWL